MFQFRAFPSYDYLIHRTILEYCSSVLPHSEISGSQLICSSPKLIAACHVLLRLLMPRHSPCALISFTSSKKSSFRFVRRLRRTSAPLRFLLLSGPNPLRWALSRFRYGLSSLWFSELCRFQQKFTKTKLYLPLKKFHN